MKPVPGLPTAAASGPVASVAAADPVTLRVQTHHAIEHPTGKARIGDVGQEICRMWLRMASGERSKAGVLGFGDDEFVAREVGAVM